jgi:hypothetical protein
MDAPSAFSRFYDSLLILMPFFPLFIAVVAGSVAGYARNWRRVVHGLAFVTMLLTMPLYMLGRSVIAPETEYPIGAEAILLMWIVMLLLTAIIYAGHVWLSSRDIAAMNQPNS